MTLPTENNSISHIGNGVLTNFTYDFRVDDADHMHVYLDTTELLTGFTVNDVGEPTGGTVDFDDPPGNLVRVTLTRVVPLTQETDYQPFDPFPAESHEQALDKLTMITQQLEEQASRSLIVPPGSDPNIDYTAPAYDAGKAIMWHQTEQRLTNTSESIQDVIDVCQDSAVDAAADAAAAAASAAAALVSEGNAATSESNASDSEDKAQEWAENPENTEVEVGQYSALHHAAKAEDWATKAQQWAEEDEDTEVEAGAYSAKHWAAKSQEYAEELESALTIATGEVAWNWAAAGGRVRSLTLTADCELQNPTNESAGMSAVLRVQQDGTGARAFTFDTDYDWGLAGAPTIPTDASAEILLGFYADGTTIKAWQIWQTA